MSQPDPLKQLQQRLGVNDRQQILLWQRMSPIQRLEVAFQAYSLALEAVRLTERQRHPDLPAIEFNWRVIRRLQGNQNLGKQDGQSNHPPRIR